MTAEQKRPAMDRNGEVIADFSMTMHNLGLQRAADELVKMLDAGYWQKFVQAFQTFEFLPGEFDYFLTSQDITRDMVMAIRDMEAKARLEEAMDERKTGDSGYRRPIVQVRAEVPQIPGRLIVPFGYTKNERKVLVNGGGHPGDPFRRSHRPALGPNTRRFRKTGGTTARSAAERRPMWQRLAASAVRLEDADLEALYEALRAERAKRRKGQS